MGSLGDFRMAIATTGVSYIRPAGRPGARMGRNLPNGLLRDTQAARRACWTLSLLATVVTQHLRRSVRHPVAKLPSLRHRSGREFKRAPESPAKV